MKVLVVDDEPLARERLSQLLKECDFVSDVLTANHGIQALEVTQEHKPDVVLLDIRMPGMDGLEAAQHLNAMNKAPAIIFVTAYDEYALAAFKVHAVDYLLKPVREEKLIKALRHATQLNRAQMAAIKSQPDSRSNITAKISGNIKLIAVEDVVYFLAEQKYVTVKYTGGETIIEDTLKELQAEFDHSFVRIHRNALVAKKFITGLQKDAEGHSYVTLSHAEQRLEISRRHLAAVKKLITSL